MLWINCYWLFYYYFENWKLMDVFKFCFLGRMGVFLDKLKIDKYNEGGVGNILRYGFSSM